MYNIYTHGRVYVYYKVVTVGNGRRRVTSRPDRIARVTTSRARRRRRWVTAECGVGQEYDAGALSTLCALQPAHANISCARGRMGREHGPIMCV